MFSLFVHKLYIMLPYAVQGSTSFVGLGHYCLVPYLQTRDGYCPVSYTHLTLPTSDGV